MGIMVHYVTTVLPSHLPVTNWRRSLNVEVSASAQTPTSEGGYEQGVRINIFTDYQKLKSLNLFGSQHLISFSRIYIRHTFALLIHIDSYTGLRISDLLGLIGIKYSTHSFRKSFGRRIWSNNSDSEKSLVLLSQIFNHSSIAITRRYLGIREEEVKNVYLSL